MKTKSLTKSFLSAVFLIAGLPLLAQDAAEEVVSNEETIITISNKACECTRNISVEISRDSIVNSINSCITSAIIEDQAKQQLSDMEKLVEKAVKAKNDTVVGEGETYTIIVDKNFDEIQAYMFENCPAVKILLGSNNLKSKYSMSKNKKALRFYEEGQVYSGQGKYDIAIVSFNKAVKADSKFTFAWDNLGVSYRKMGNYKEAIKCYQKSLEIDPGGTMPLQNMAVAYTFLEDHEKAAEIYMKFIKLYPDNPEGYFGAGKSFYLSGKQSEGVDNMFKAYKIYAETKSPYVNDAQQVLAAFYKDLNEQGKLNIFMEAAKKNDIQIQE